MIKAAFFDIDGTLVSFNTHEVPSSTWQALDRLREQGIKVIISSGRPAYQLQPFLCEGFDAYVTISGSLCYDGDGVYLSTPLDKEDVKTIVGRVGSGEYEALALLRDSAVLSGRNRRVSETEEKSNLVYPLGDFSSIVDEDVYQMCAFVGQVDDDKVLAGTSRVKTTRWTDLFCDVIPKTGGKRAGVLATCERYGIDPADTIAFGDGENDLSMFDAVGTSIAMGNAWDAVKDRADYLTDDVDHDGIYNACKHFGLL